MEKSICLEAKGSFVAGNVDHVLLFSVTASEVASAQFKEEWVARYNGTGEALALDAAGNVYVTGSCFGADGTYDYATIKYDSNGNELWVARYNGPGNGDDLASALAVDAMGNVYVTGYSSGSVDPSSLNYATIKYDFNGNELWVARYNGLGNGPGNGLGNGETF